MTWAGLLKSSQGKQIWSDVSDFAEASAYHGFSLSKGKPKEKWLFYIRIYIQIYQISKLIIHSGNQILVVLIILSDIAQNKKSLRDTGPCQEIDYFHHKIYGHDFIMFLNDNQLFLPDLWTFVLFWNLGIYIGVLFIHFCAKTPKMAANGRFLVLTPKW